MTRNQKVLLYAAQVVASFLFTWPAGILMLCIFAEANGDIPTRQPE
jgi:hypothetical protein